MIGQAALECQPPLISLPETSALLGPTAAQRPRRSPPPPQRSCAAAEEKPGNLRFFLTSRRFDSQDSDSPYDDCTRAAYQTSAGK